MKRMVMALAVVALVAACADARPHRVRGGSCGAVQQVTVYPSQTVVRASCAGGSCATIPATSLVVPASGCANGQCPAPVGRVIVTK